MNMKFLKKNMNIILLVVLVLLVLYYSMPKEKFTPVGFDEDYLLVCSINDSEDVKLRSFSENVLLIPGVQPKTIKGDKK